VSIGLVRVQLVLYKYGSFFVIIDINICAVKYYNTSFIRNVLFLQPELSVRLHKIAINNTAYATLANLHNFVPSDRNIMLYNIIRLSRYSKLRPCRYDIGSISSKGARGVLKHTNHYIYIFCHF